MTATSRSVVTAMLCAATVAAQFVAGKATRDALFLTAHDISVLPTMLIVTAVCSLVLVSLHARVGRLVAPSTLVPASFVVSALLFFAEWLLRASAPSTVALLVYLHVSVAGQLLASGFWLIVSELYSPRTAKKGVGQIAGAGTLGGIAGAIVAERMAATLGVPGMLIVLGALQMVTAAFVYRLARSLPPRPRDLAARPRDLPPVRSGLHRIATTPYLRRMAALVLLSTASAALVDYVFKAAAVDTFGPGDGLLRFFSVYYGLTGVASFVLQVAASRRVFDRLGIAGTTSAPSIALAGGALAALAFPGLGALVAARSGEAVFRGSWFRAGYELFFSPIPVAEKRATKSLIDVTFDRVGDAVGGALIPIVLLVAPGLHTKVLLLVALILSIGAVAAASRLTRWYVRTLEDNLLDHGRDAGLLDAGFLDADPVTLALVRQLRPPKAGDTGRAIATAGAPPVLGEGGDAILQDVATLRLQDHRRIVRLLTREEGMPAALVPHAIPLLAIDALADYALFALRKVAEEHVGQLTDALLDPNQTLAVRRRLARVFSVCVSQRAIDGLVAALDDERFDVRFQVARSLRAVLSSNPALAVDPARIYGAVLKEVAVGRPVWEGRRLLDGFVSASPLDAFVRDRAGQSLAHVFTLLSLVLPRDPLQVAFRGLQGDDEYLRGTALEYLEGVLPEPVRQPLWPFLVRSRATRPTDRREQRVVELLRSSGSVTLQGAAARLGGNPVAGSGEA